MQILKIHTMKILIFEKTFINDVKLLKKNIAYINKLLIDYSDLGNNLYSLSLYLLDFDSMGVEFREDNLMQILLKDDPDKYKNLSGKNFLIMKNSFLASWRNYYNIVSKREKAGKAKNSASFKYSEELIEINKVIDWIETSFSLESISSTLKSF